MMLNRSGKAEQIRGRGRWRGQTVGWKHHADDRQEAIDAFRAMIPVGSLLVAVNRGEEGRRDVYALMPQLPDDVTPRLIWIGMLVGAILDHACYNGGPKRAQGVHFGYDIVGNGWGGIVKNLSRIVHGDPDSYPCQEL